MESQAVFFFFVAQVAKLTGGTVPAKKEAWEQMIRGHQASRFLQDLVTSVSLSLIQIKIVLSQKHETFYNWGSFFKKFQMFYMLMNALWFKVVQAPSCSYCWSLVVGRVFQGRADDLNLKGTCIDGRHDQRSSHQSCILSAGFRLLFAQD